MPKSEFFLGCFFILSATLQAQDLRDASLSGRVTHLGNPVSDVHVMNLSSEKATISDDDGFFTIGARLRDTLLFSAVQLKRHTLVVTGAMLQSKGIIVPLEEFVNELDEVVVRPYNLSGDISRDLQQMLGERVVVASTIGLPNAYIKPPTQAERKLYEATSGGGIVPLNPVINAITGRTRYLKKILATERKYARTRRVREFYADSLFISDLGIPESKIDDFMYFCEVDASFDALAKSDDTIAIWSFLLRKSTMYRENNGLD